MLPTTTAGLRAPAENIRPARGQRAKRAPVTDTAVKVVAAPDALTRRVGVAGGKFDKVSDRLGTAGDTAHHIADQHRVAGFQGRM